MLRKVVDIFRVTCAERVGEGVRLAKKHMYTLFKSPAAVYPAFTHILKNSASVSRAPLIFANGSCGALISGKAGAGGDLRS
ncbi:hypothetical protein V9T40_007101 [Parthenolecanium corni]|uniref:Uncharacterized protein n=1 Tax=Parthenolecanium corni TaxID=536013 RepID=A0AAN9U4M5_9HEMI